MGLRSTLIFLAARGVRYRCLKAMGKPGRPEAMSMEVTRRCIAKCVIEKNGVLN